MADTAQTARIREKYQCYKVADLAVRLFLNDVSQEDTAYIMQGGETVKMKPYPKLQEWLASAMDRMAERIPEEKAKRMRQDSACCLTGTREQLAREIYRNYDTVDARFEALSKERRIIGGNAWKKDDGYYISFWYAKPKAGYTCGCLRHVPEAPMNRLWCECCAGHIRHHFETALGVNAVCECVTSVLGSAGEDACLFRLNIVSENEADVFSDALGKCNAGTKACFSRLREIINETAGGKAEEKIWAKIPSFYVGENFVRLIPFKDHINVEASAVALHTGELDGYKITPKGMLQIYEGQPVPAVFGDIVRESLKL